MRTAATRGALCSTIGRVQPARLRARWLVLLGLGALVLLGGRPPRRGGTCRAEWRQKEVQQIYAQTQYVTCEFDYDASNYVAASDSCTSADARDVRAAFEAADQAAAHLGAVPRSKEAERDMARDVPRERGRPAAAALHGRAGHRDRARGLDDSRRLVRTARGLGRGVDGADCDNASAWRRSRGAEARHRRRRRGQRGIGAAQRWCHVEREVCRWRGRQRRRTARDGRERAHRMVLRCAPSRRAAASSFNGSFIAALDGAETGPIPVRADADELKTRCFHCPRSRRSRFGTSAPPGMAGGASGW